jgi:gliding motility-associated-like protein/uncharacterized repeat protein (TIGR01451 family)
MIKYQVIECFKSYLTLIKNILTVKSSRFFTKYSSFKLLNLFSVILVLLLLNLDTFGNSHAGLFFSNDSLSLNEKPGVPSETILVKDSLSNPEGQSTIQNAKGDQPDVISVIAKIKNTSCKAPNIGSIELTVSGGSGNYNFSWSNGSNSQDISSLVAGNYTVTIIDQDDPNNLLIEAFHVGIACLDFKKEVVEEPFMDSDSTYTVTFRLELSNTGDIDLTGIYIDDWLDPVFNILGTTYFSPVVISDIFITETTYLGESESSLLLSNAILEVGQEGYIDILVRVQQGVKNQTYTNTAIYQFEFDGGEGTGGGIIVIEDVSNDAPVEFVDRPEVQITKTALTANVDSVSDKIDYLIEVKNTGNTILTNLVVTDSLTGLLQNISTLSVGATVTMTTVYTVTQEDLDMGVITNTVTVTGYFKSVEVSDSSSVQVPVIQLPALSILKTSLVSSYGKLGDVIGYELVVLNTGNVTLTDVLVEDPLANFSYTVSTLAVNQTITLTTTYTVTQADLDAGLIINTVTATTEFGSTTLTDSDDDTVYGQQFPGLALLKTARPIVFTRLGEVITYDISVTNTGNVTLSNVLVTDPLTGLSQTISTLGASNTYTITTTYGVTQANLDAGLVANLATASSTYSTTLLTDSDDETVLGSKLPAISIIKTARKNTFNKSGEIIFYDILVRNTGNVTLYNILVSDPLTGLSSTIPVISVGGSQVISTTYSIKQSDILAKSVSNTATASGIFYGQRLSVSDNELITSSQKPPIAVDDKNTTLISVKVSGNVLPNDSDPDGDALTVTQFVVSGKTYTAGSTAVITGVGTIVLNSNGSYTFTPLPKYVGPVPAIRYTITDGNETFARAYLRIVVIPLVNPPELIVEDTSICENEIAVLSVGSKNVENPVYTWFTDSATTNQVFVGPSFITPKLTQTTVYYVRLSESNLLPALPLIVKKVTVNVIPLPTKPNVTISGKSILCPGDSTKLVSSEAIAYQWYKNGIVITGANSQFIVIKEVGDYTVRTIGITNCYSNSSDKISISIPSLPPTPVITADKQKYCLGDTATITSSLPSVNLWYRNGIQLLLDSGKSIKTTLPGTYTVIHKTVNGCFTSISNAIALTFNDVPAKPNIIIDGPVIFCEGDYRILKTTIPQGASVQWYKDGVLMDGRTKDTLRITVAGKYTARLINTSGCTSPFSDCICTEIKCETDIYTPDIFTPNDDDINDVIKPSIPGIRKFVCFKVYNRWGNLIFYTTDPYKGWDGKYKGSIQPAETYMWIVEGFDSSGKKIKKSGMLSLMR